TFTLAEGEMEVGIGIHGEPGSHRGKLETADEITDRFLAEILGELEPAPGDRVAVLVNGLGATPLEELYLVYRRVHQVLGERGVVIHRRYVGEFATSLEMAGASVSVLLLDDELAELIDAPAASPFFGQGNTEAPEPRAAGVGAPGSAAVRGPAPAVRRTGAAGALRGALVAAMERMPAHAEELRLLDSRLGDGDLGITVSSGAEAVREALLALPEDAHHADVLRAAATAFASANPSTFAALTGAGVLAAAAESEELASVSVRDAARLTSAVSRRVRERGGAEPGDKTFVDGLLLVEEALEGADDPVAAVRAAASAAGRAVEETSGLTSAKGRAAWVGERGAGERDPGSVALLRFLEELRDVLS
ncbi:dihydroxyacetone kinase subunit DhaK, partial [Nocardiopsis tropica]|nr:dihydroxyacetone kinase subunit DhaK [Nocardiopsis tropica]